jgi:tetrapyrrole methylase family protein/MazG family protein
MSIPTLDSILSALGLEAGSTLTVFDARQAADRHLPPFPPDLPTLLVHLDGPGALTALVPTLAAVYPGAHRVQLVEAAVGNTLSIREVPLADLAASGPAIAIFLPALAQGNSFEAFQEVIAALRAPDGCPWDREQTHLSLRKHLLEEGYEALAAMDAEDPAMMREEFGDLLLQIVLNAQIASEADEFRMSDVLKEIHDKIIRRHPHVFGDLKLEGVEEVLENWERLKADERKAGGKSARSLLEGLPASLPGLTQAQEYQARAARVGFRWSELEQVLEKVREEIDEVRHAEDPKSLSDELGDLLFALANLARWKEVDAEAALRGTNARFRQRFEYVEGAARLQGRAIAEFSEDELVALWEDAKRQAT